jgi:nitroreductase
MVYEMRKNRVAVVRPESCIKCGHCGSACPAGAIVESSVESKRRPAPGPDSLPTAGSLQLLFRSRRSVRRYKSKPLAGRDLSRILEAGRYTATGSNAQNIRYIVLTDPEKIAQLREMTLPAIMRLFSIAGRTASLPFASNLLGEAFAERLKNRYAPGMKVLYKRQVRGEDRLFYNAPAIMLVCGDRWDETSGFSAAAALYNCSLMAHALGIGCCFNGFVQTTVNRHTRIRNWFGISRSEKCYGAMILGYPNVTYNRLVKRSPPNVTIL